MAEGLSQYRTKHILYCHCGGERIPADLAGTVGEYLKTAPVNVTHFSDLCGLVALKRETLSGLFEAGGDYLVIGCYRRTMDWLFEQAGLENEKPEGIEFLNLIESDRDAAITHIAGFCGNAEGHGVFREIREESGWPSWYPVIDHSRCTNCGQCADFCLFGVYEKTETRIDVVNPQGCKNNCPACARICPSTAIIFPKYQNGGAIGGAEELDEIAEQRRQAQDIETFLGHDLYNALERRKAKRRSIIREDAMARAIEERAKAEMDISVQPKKS